MGPTGGAGLGENEPICSGEELGGAEAEADAAGTVGRRGAAGGGPRVTHMWIAAESDCNMSPHFPLGESVQV